MGHLRMNGKAPSYQHYPDKWIADTRRLSWKAKGIYKELLDVIWMQFQNTCSIPDIDDLIAKEIGASIEDWKEAKAEIMHAFRPLLEVISIDETGDSENPKNPRLSGMTNPRLFSRGLWKEFRKQEQFRISQAEKGRKGGRPRKPEKPAAFDESAKPAKPEKSLPSPSPIPSPSPTPESKEKTSKRKKLDLMTFSKSIAPALFVSENGSDKEQFWELWRDFIDFRKTIKKPMTERAVKSIFKKLEAMGFGDACESLEQSIERGWAGVFEPKGSNQNFSNRTPVGQREMPYR